MSVTVPYSAKLTGSTGTTSTVTITAPTPGNTLLVDVWVPTANAPAVSFSDPLNGAWPAPDNTVTALNGNFTVHSYRFSNIPNAPTSLSVAGTTGSFSAIFEVIEAANMDNISPVVATISKTALSGGASQTTHVASYTTSNTNDFVKLGSNNTNLRLLSSVTAVNMAVVAPESVTSQAHLSYLADAGAAGTKSSTLTFSGACSAWVFGVVYKAAKPAVTSVSNETGAEGVTITHTVTLASATTATTGYSGVLTGVTASTTTDLTSTLLTATYSNGVTFSAGNFSVPSGVSSWTVAIVTTQDVLDEVDETYTLNVDGTIGTGTITDDDAAPTISVNDASENAMQVAFTVSLSAASGKTITVDYATANGSKTAGTDYTAATGTLTFAAGETSKTVTVAVL